MSSGGVTERDPIVQYVDDSDGITSDVKCSEKLCDPRRFFFRYFALFFMCFLSFGSYFCYVNIPAINLKIKKDF